MIERQYIRQLNEAIQKSKTVDSLSDSMQNWKKAARALTDAGENGFLLILETILSIRLN